MKTIRQEIKEFALVHIAVVVFVCAVLFTSALSSDIASGPTVDLGDSGRESDAISYPYTR